MTRIKYATVAHGRGTDRLIVIRGKKEGRVGFLPDDDVDDPFGIALYAENVIELPRPMSPTEYEEWIEQPFAERPKVGKALIDVAREKDISTEKWEWKNDLSDTDTERDSE